MDCRVDRGHPADPEHGFQAPLSVEHGACSGLDPLKKLGRRRHGKFIEVVTAESRPGKGRSFSVARTDPGRKRLARRRYRSGNRGARSGSGFPSISRTLRPRHGSARITGRALPCATRGKSRAHGFSAACSQRHGGSTARVRCSTSARETFIWRGQLAAALAPGSRVVCFDEHYTDRHLSELAARSPELITRGFAPRTGSTWCSARRDRARPGRCGFLGGFVQQNLDARVEACSSACRRGRRCSRCTTCMLGHYRRYRPAQLLRVIEARRAFA